MSKTGMVLGWESSGEMEKRWTDALTITITVLVLTIIGIEFLAGITTIAAHLLYIPVVITAYWYPRRGVPVGIALGGIYLLELVAFVPLTRDALIVALLRIAVLITVAALVSSLSHRHQAVRHLVQIEHDLAQDLTRTTEYDAAVSLSLDALMSIPEIDAVGIVLHGRDEHPGPSAFVRGVSESFPGAVFEQAGDMQIPSPENQGKARYLSRDDTSPAIRSVLQHEGILSIAFIPIRHDGEWIASLHAGSRRYLVVPPDIRRTLESFAALIGGALSRIQAEEAMERSERLYRTLFENTGTAMLIIEEDTTISLANEEVLAITGYSPDDLQEGLSWVTFVPREERDRLLEYSRLRRRDPTLVPRSYETTCIHRDGTLRDIMVTVAPIPGTTRTVASIMDITSRKHLEEELRAINEFQESIIQNAHVLLMALRYPGVVIVWNKAAEEITGYPANEVVGSNEIWKRLYPDPDYRRRLTASIRRIISEDNYLENLETEIRTRDGRARIIQWNTRPMDRDAEGRDRYIAIGRDITERRAAERALRESEEKFRRLVENLNEIVFVLDEHAVITYISPNIESVSGYSAPDVIGRPYIEFVHPDDRAGRQDLFGKVIAGSSLSTEYRFLTRDGDVVWMKSSNTPVVKDGRIIGVQGILTDITDLKKIEEELHAALYKLDLLSSITRHDILNQVQIIRGYLDLIHSGGVTDEQVRTYIERIEAPVRTIERQISFTREYQKMGQHTPSWVEVIPLLRTVADETLPEGITLDLGPELSRLQVYADPMLGAVFHNLLENAARHGRGVTRIRVSFLTEDQTGILSVQDDGNGVPPEMKESIFERGVGENTGFGLFLAREVLDITGIAIRETGVHGEGARFELVIPPDCWKKGNS